MGYSNGQENCVEKNTAFTSVYQQKQPWDRHDINHRTPPLSFCSCIWPLTLTFRRKKPFGQQEKERHWEYFCLTFDVFFSKLGFYSWLFFPVYLYRYLNYYFHVSFFSIPFPLPLVDMKERQLFLFLFLSSFFAFFSSSSWTQSKLSIQLLC